MFEKTKDEIVRSGGTETIVGASVKLKGNLKSDGDILIDGVVTGDLKTKGSVVIGESASVIANVKAQNVIISGDVQGNIEAAEKIELTPGGRVIGDISSGVLSIAPGAVFSGKSTMVENHREISKEPVMEEGPDKEVEGEAKGEE